MGDLAGILVLLGLVVLAVPILLIMALVSISGLKRRVGELEEAVYRQQPGVATPAQTRPEPAYRPLTRHRRTKRHSCRQRPRVSPRLPS